jgi:amino acid adenylation domain-containing protein
MRNLLPLPNEERERRTSFEGSAVFDRDQIEGTIIHRFETIVQRYADRPAISDHGQRWTYHELNQSANRIAHAIFAHRGISEEPVPLILGHSAAAVIAAMGVLKSGTTYCALDPSHPQARLSQIIQELQSEVIVTDSANAALAQRLGHNRCPLILIDNMDTKLPMENPTVIPSSLAAIFYTSGSTGQPKGVQHTQRTILHRAWWETTANQITPDDCMSQLFSLSFGASIVDMFGALLNGACLCLFDFKTEASDVLEDWLRREQVTWFHIPVAPFRVFLDLLPATTQFPRVRHLVPAGPIFRTDLTRCWNHFPNCALISHMGASETSAIAQMTVTPTTEFRGNVVPLGYPVADKEILILDDAGNPLPGEQVGEIAVRSRYLTAGYWRRPDLTARSFVDDPSGGDLRMYRTGDLGRISIEGYLEYLGRRDAQIKIRGYRVDLSEVEAALHPLATIKESVVIARESPSGEKQLLAYVVLKSGHHHVSPSDLRSALRHTLPDYMVPSAFMIVAEIPRTANGKVDAVRLPDPGRERPASAEYAAPQNLLETELCKLWAEVLSLDTVGIHDSFLELGGHSLMATQIVSRILTQYGIRLSPLQLLESATVATQAAAILEELAPADSPGLAQLVDRVEQLSEEEARKLLREDGAT